MLAEAQSTTIQEEKAFFTATRISRIPRKSLECDLGGKHLRHVVLEWKSGGFVRLLFDLALTNVFSFFSSLH